MTKDEWKLTRSVLKCVQVKFEGSMGRKMAANDMKQEITRLELEAQEKGIKL